jgi:hypothetical protein
MIYVMFDLYIKPCVVSMSGDVDQLYRMLPTEYTYYLRTEE